MCFTFALDSLPYPSKDGVTWSLHVRSFWLRLSHEPGKNVGGKGRYLYFIFFSFSLIGNELNQSL